MANEITQTDTVPIQDVPETSSDERMHILDETCWCEPTIDGEYLRHNRRSGG